jgi:signal transduction histidine kinase/streptogramin lyase
LLFAFDCRTIKKARDSVRSISFPQAILGATFSILFGSTPLAAGPVARRYVFDWFGAQQGLQNVVVNVLCQDRDGFLWVGTENGLYRYDGHRFLRFTTADGLPDKAITGLYESQDGTLWAGTVKGLAWRNGIRFTSPRDPTLHGQTFTQAVTSDREGHLFIVTGKGLARAKLSAGAKDLLLEPLPPPPGAEHARITSVWRDPDGALWFGCGVYICRTGQGRTQVWGESAGVPSDAWQFLLKDSGGNLWARSRTYLIELPAGAQQFRPATRSDAGPLHFSYPSLALDGNGALLMPSDNGLAIWKDGAWTRVGSRQGLPGSIVTSVLRDRAGSLWVGTTTGLVRWTGYGAAESFTEVEGLSSGTNMALLEDAGGGVWAGTSGGLSHGVFRDGAWRWSAVDDPNLAWVVNLAQAKDGAIWLTSVDPQVLRLDPRTGKTARYGHFDAAPFSLLIDRADNVWTILTHALFRGSAHNPASGFEQVSPPGSAPNTVFTRAAEDVHGDLWFGTFSGLFRLSGGEWSHFQKADGLSGNQVLWLTAAPNGDLYVRYFDESVIDCVHPDGGRLRVERLDRLRGLADVKIYSMRIDREGRLWALTDHGPRLREDGNWIPFDQSDGLLWSDCNTFLAGSDGGIWIGSDRGLTRLPSPKPRTPERDPSVKFSEVRLSNRLADYSAPLVEAEPEPFTAKFTTLDLARAGRVQYRYRCVGFDEQWTETARPEVTFDYLRPGTYRLEVQARWPWSTWHGAPASLELTVRPRWFETAWFETLLAMLICSALWIAWRARIKHYAAARVELQSEVDVRTTELRMANEQLREEIGAREQAAREKEHLEQELFQAKKLESIGRLAGGVAHDFNNLLTIINGYSEMLLTNLSPDEPDGMFAREISKAGERAVGLTRQLLAFSRKQIIKPTAVNVNAIVKDMELMLRRLIGEDIEVIATLDPELGEVMADPDQVHQVLMNLVVNARDAMPGGGRLSIATRNVEVDASAGTGAVSGRCILVTVADSGVGMDEITRQNAFEPFFTTKGQGKGTGLGLATVYGIIRQSNGWIDITSELGKGTTFHIYLPRLEVKFEPKKTGVAAADLSGEETILVVEDQDAVREFTRTVLESYGHTVLEAADGKSACALAGQYTGDIHLLLTDTVMPGMNGKVLSERLLKMRPNLRVLFMSGYTADVIGHHGVLELEVAYIPKPFTPEGLAAKVREVLAAPRRA